MSEHRQLMEAPEGLVVDHLDGNHNNNAISNLRVCTYSANSNNLHGRILQEGKDYCGVMQRDGLWRVAVCEDGEIVELGLFESITEANALYLSTTSPLCTCSKQRQWSRRDWLGEDQTYQIERLVVRVPDGWLRTLALIAAKEDRSVSYIVRKALELAHPILKAKETKS